MPANHREVLTALASGVVGLGVGVAAGAWWGRRIAGHIYRDGDDWYVDEPVLRELQRRIHRSGDTRVQGVHDFSLFGRGSIKLVPTQRKLPEQVGALYTVHPVLSASQTLEFVMLDLVLHRVGKLKLIRYTPRQVPGRMVQGPNVGPGDKPEGVPPGFGA